MGESLWQRAPPFQLAGSPSPQTVGLTFSIQVSGLKCRYEQFFLLQRSQTAGRGVGTNPPAFLSLPRQNETEGDVQHQTPGHRHWSRPALANLTHPLPPPWPAHPLAGFMASRAPGFSPLPALRGLQGAEQPPQASTRSGCLGTLPCVLLHLGSGPPAVPYSRPCVPHLGALQDGVGAPVFQKKLASPVRAVERGNRTTSRRAGEWAVSRRPTQGLGSLGHPHKVRPPLCPTLPRWLLGPGPQPGGFSAGRPAGAR